MTTGQRIRQARKNAGMTQKELGARLGVSFQGIAQWENDLRNPKYETLQRLAAVLGVDAWTLKGNAAGPGGEIARFREARELSATQLSVMTGIPLTRLQELELGLELPTAPESEQLARVLGAAEGPLRPSAQQELLLRAFFSLNEAGRAVAVERVAELAKIPDYQNETGPQPPD